MNGPFTPCPFCRGQKLKVEYKSKRAGYNGPGYRVEYHTFSVRCNVCHCRGPAVGGKVLRMPWLKDLPEWATTDDKLREEAINKWNERL